jgi:type II secretory pathway pseudopilin PulG
MNHRGMTGHPGKSHHQSPGFSLVEVTVAIGIMAFCLLGVVGLLPTGLKSIKNANEQAGAANVLGGIADALRNAVSTDGTAYEATFGGETFSYSLGGGPSSTQWDMLSLNGQPDAEEGRLRARLDILQAPVANPPRPGRAVLSVAWPVQANPTWVPATQTWSKAEGSVTMGIQFMPGPRTE